LPFVIFRPAAVVHNNSGMASAITATNYALHQDTVEAIAAGRVQFIRHAGHRILFINYAHCDASMLKAVAEEGHRVIAREKPGTVLTLNDVSGTVFDKESVAVLQAKVAENAAYVQRAAVVGISGLQRLIYESVQAFTRRRIPNFQTRQEALSWLVSE
jgi:hypothetical protein